MEERRIGISFGWVAEYWLVARDTVPNGGMVWEYPTEDKKKRKQTEKKIKKTCLLTINLRSTSHYHKPPARTRCRRKNYNKAVPPGRNGKERYGQRTC